MARRKKGYYIDGKYRKDLRGWWDESERHRMARLGVKTGTPNPMFNQAFLWNESVRKMSQKDFQNADFDNDGVPNKDDALPFLPADYKYDVKFAKGDFYEVGTQFKKAQDGIARTSRRGKKGQIISMIPELLMPEGVYFAKLPKIDVIDPYSDSKKVIARKERKVKYFIDYINGYSAVPITSDNLKYMSEIMAGEEDNPVWQNLSPDDESSKHFDIAGNRADPSEPIVFIDVNFLSTHRGNLLRDESKAGVREALKNDVKFEIPFYEMRTGEVGEGNHRIWLMKELGYRSVPVRIFWNT